MNIFLVFPYNFWDYSGFFFLIFLISFIFSFKFYSWLNKNDFLFSNLKITHFNKKFYFLFSLQFGLSIINFLLQLFFMFFNPPDFLISDAQIARKNIRTYIYLLNDKIGYLKNLNNQQEAYNLYCLAVEAKNISDNMFVFEQSYFNFENDINNCLFAVKYSIKLNIWWLSLTGWIICLLFIICVLVYLYKSRTTYISLVLIIPVFVSIKFWLWFVVILWFLGFFVRKNLQIFLLNFLKKFKHNILKIDYVYFFVLFLLIFEFIFELTLITYVIKVNSSCYYSELGITKLDQTIKIYSEIQRDLIEKISIIQQINDENQRLIFNDRLNTLLFEVHSFLDLLNNQKLQTLSIIDSSNFFTQLIDCSVINFDIFFIIRIIFFIFVIVLVLLYIKVNVAN